MAFGFGSITCGCGEKNPKDAKFCSACGFSLGLNCPECKKPVKQGNKFCPDCGKAIGEAASGPEIVVWKRDPGEFARHIELARDDRLQYGGIIVPPGTTAVIIEDGEIVGQVSAGKYTVEAIETAESAAGGNEAILRRTFDRIQQFWKEKEKNPKLSYPDISALLVDAAERRFSFPKIRAKTSDPLMVDVDVEVRVTVKDPVLFLTNVLKGNPGYTFDNVWDDLVTVVEGTVSELVGKSPIAVLRSNLANVATSIRDDVNVLTERDGYSLVAVFPPIVRQEGLDAADKIKSDSAEKQAIGDAGLTQAEIETRMLKRKAEIQDEVRGIQTQDEISERKKGDTLWEDDHQRTVRREEAGQEDVLKRMGRTQEMERQSRMDSKENLRDDMERESEVKTHGRAEEFKDTQHQEGVTNLRFEGDITREGRIRELDLKTKEEKYEFWMKKLGGLQDIKAKKEEQRQKAVAFDHQKEMEKLTKEQEHHLDTKKIDIEGKKIDAGRDVEVAKADTEGSRKRADELIAKEKELRQESDSKSERMLGMAERMVDRFADFGEKNIEAVSGVSRQREKMSEKHLDQMKDVLVKGKGSGSATQKEGKDNNKIKCPGCGEDVQPGKFCVKCGDSLQS